MIPPEQRTAFEQEMSAGEVDWRMTSTAAPPTASPIPPLDGAPTWPRSSTTSRPTNAPGEPCSICSTRFLDPRGPANARVGPAGVLASAPWWISSSRTCRGEEPAGGRAYGPASAPNRSRQGSRRRGQLPGQVAYAWRRSSSASSAEPGSPAGQRDRSAGRPSQGPFRSSAEPRRGGRAATRGSSRPGGRPVAPTHRSGSVRQPAAGPSGTRAPAPRNTPRRRARPSGPPTAARRSRKAPPDRRAPSPRTAILGLRLGAGRRPDPLRRSTRRHSRPALSDGHKARQPGEPGPSGHQRRDSCRVGDHSRERFGEGFLAYLRPVSIPLERLLSAPVKGARRMDETFEGQLPGGSFSRAGAAFVARSRQSPAPTSG